MTHVAGVIPALGIDGGGRLLRSIQITLHDLRTADPQLAFLAAAYLTAAVDGDELQPLAVLGVAREGEEAERARLGRDLAAAQKELDQAEKKLANPKFVEKAPADVVDGIRVRREAAVAEIERVTARLAALPAS
jgi:hypothetical protein